MRVVLDHKELVLIGNLADGLHVRALSVQMDGDNRFRARRDGGLDLGGVEVVGLGIGVHKHGSGAGNPDCLGGGEECVGGGDALVARANAKGEESEPERVGTAIDPDGVLQAVIFA